MERINLVDINQTMYLEHQHRYKWASQMLSGNVVDVACGVGYGSQIIIQNKNITKYYGIDTSKEAIFSARKKFGKDGKAIFSLGSIEKMDFKENSIDNLISLETLEHLDNPYRAVKEIKRVLKKKGVFVGSVPTSSMETLCTKVYGKNKYHKKTFSFEDIELLLQKSFKYYAIYVIGVNTASVVLDAHRKPKEIINGNIVLSDSVVKFGSFIFIASDQEMKTRIPEAVLGMNIVEYDYLNSASLKKLLNSAYERVEELEGQISNDFKLVSAKDYTIKEQSDMLQQKDQQIQKRDKWLKEKSQQIQKRDKWLKEKSQQLNQRNQQLSQVFNSKSYQLGSLFFRSIQKPYKLITYPYNFIKILLKK